MMKKQLRLEVTSTAFNWRWNMGRLGVGNSIQSLTLISSLCLSLSPSFFRFYFPLIQRVDYTRLPPTKTETWTTWLSLPPSLPPSPPSLSNLST